MEIFEENKRKIFSTTKMQRLATPTFTIAMILFLTCCRIISAAPCPAETPMYGAKLDASKTYY